MRGTVSHFFAKTSRFGVMSSLAVCVVVLGGCAYVRRSTPLTPVTGTADARDAPPNLW